ncbi:MAG: hypothetical protein ABIG32_03240 [Candidatus Uhrbacteria bacterium]|nr:hypothetical protein [Patescibacteria group bacterium]MBU1907448.1 hypothetical protein [Patescibacteria group bacterium]
MDGAETTYGQDRDVCLVCGLPLGGSPIVHDDLEHVLRFCSDRCYKTYLKEPDKYIEFEEELE